jgi:DNA polymerase elongation subunit (family B)
MDKNIFEQFLEGQDEQKYIVSVESSYDNNYVHLIIHDPVDGKRIEKHRFKPFLWLKELDYRRFYKGNRNEIRKRMAEYNISFKELTYADANGEVVDRLKNGYRYLVHTSQSYSRLLDFFKYGGLNPNDNRDLFLTIGTTEQFLIQTGKRLFKGMEDYGEVHRLTFDIETTGLYPENSRIFEIGVKDNRGFEEVIKIMDESEEISGIKRFFEIIDELKPAIICGYNSENFDWNFIFKRVQIHEERIESIASTLKYDSDIKRKKATLKMGAEMEYYEQTIMWGYNIMDIWHAVRRAAAINSNIKETGLKYITKFEKMAKPNRIYISHQSIADLWNSQNEYILNDDDGKYEKYQNQELNENQKIVTGEYLVTRYLLDDLWETEQIDYIYNQATFLLSKIVPSTLQRTSTMGTAALWKTLMLGWSYENGLAIP